MVGHQAKFIKYLAFKAMSVDGLRRVARNPRSIINHARRLIYDVNLRKTSDADAVRMYDNALTILGEYGGRLLSAPLLSLEEWLPVLGEETVSDLAHSFNKYGSDKSRLHDYHRIYGSVLAGRRNDPMNILEIGLGSNNLDTPSNMGLSGTPGASLRAFREWAPLARICGADVDRRILFEEDRISTFWVDQTDVNSLRALAGKLSDRKFDLIIDDGLHLPHANINTMQALLPLLKPEGTFVVEDINGYHGFWNTAALVFSGHYDVCFGATSAAHVFVVRNRTENR